ncbi:MAG: FhaA domain-containing protein [Capsulimonadales bacterium]|nr:FhaA domain-containing protein [Capsulimonadales bacterium]
MAIDVLEKLNRRFSDLHERLFGHIGQRELRPHDILRRITAEMEASRRKGLDGYPYVPNVYTLQVAVGSEDERQYLRTFLGAEELVNAVAQEIETRGYRVKGTLLFTVEEVPPAVLEQRIRVLCRFDPDAAPTPRPEPAEAPFSPRPAPPTPAPSPILAETGDPEDEEEPGTIAAITPAVALLEVTGAGGSRTVAPVTLAGVRIGRSKRAGNDVIIENDPQVSKRHARIAYEQGRFVLYDEGSTNGTTLRDVRIPVNQPTPLPFGEAFRIGDCVLVLRQKTSAPTPPTAPPAYPASPAASTTEPSGNAIIYRLVAGDGTVHTLASEMTVGRGVTEDIVLHGNGVSSRHARLSLRGVALYVEDLNTPGGTFVNGERIPANFPVALYNEDQVRFGEVLLRVERSR